MIQLAKNKMNATQCPDPSLKQTCMRRPASPEEDMMRAVKRLRLFTGKRGGGSELPTYTATAYPATAYTAEANRRSFAPIHSDNRACLGTSQAAHLGPSHLVPGRPLSPPLHADVGLADGSPTPDVDDERFKM